jgi:hypothetical protein
VADIDHPIISAVNNNGVPHPNAELGVMVNVDNGKIAIGVPEITPLEVVNVRPVAAKLVEIANEVDELMQDAGTTDVIGTPRTNVYEDDAYGHPIKRATYATVNVVEDPPPKTVYVSELDVAKVGEPLMIPDETSKETPAGNAGVTE